ncbi:MAG: hypothetical protein H6658_05365 [Ardenticatenaceae bacterium]|nr:hypothetical protein [Ardenticatenaceae bacterium]
MKRLTVVLLLMSILAACSPAGEPAASEPQAAPVVEVAASPTAVPTTSTPRTQELPAPVLEEPEATAVLPETEPTELPESEETAVIPTEAPAEETGPTVISGRLDEGSFFLGDPNAPVTLIDYSDFL